MAISKDPQTLSNILSHKQLEAVLAKAKRMMTIQRQLGKILDNEALSHCHVLNIVNNQLIVSVDNAAWATRIRYEEAEMVQYLQQFPDTRMIQYISCRIRPESEVSELAEMPKVERHISNESRQMIRDLAEDIEDPKLKRALEKLSQ